MSLRTLATVSLVGASVALAVALIAVGLAIVVMRQNGHAVEVLRRHRIAHKRAEGFADPIPEDDTPPARGAQRYTPPTGTMPALGRTHDDAPTVEAAATRPRPGGHRP